MGVVRMRPSGTNHVVIVPSGCGPGRRFQFAVPRSRRESLVLDNALGDTRKREKRSEEAAWADAKKAKWASLLCNPMPTPTTDLAANDVASYFRAEVKATGLASHLQSITAPIRPGDSNMTPTTVWRVDSDADTSMGAQEELVRKR